MKTKLVFKPLGVALLLTLAVCGGGGGAGGDIWAFRTLAIT